MAITIWRAESQPVETVRASGRIRRRNKRTSGARGFDPFFVPTNSAPAKFNLKPPKSIPPRLREIEPLDLKIDPSVVNIESTVVEIESTVVEIEGPVVKIEGPVVKIAPPSARIPLPDVEMPLPVVKIELTSVDSARPTFAKARTAAESIPPVVKGVGT